MRSLIAALLLGVYPAAPAMAILDGTTDTADRFPFVVEIKQNGALICSGTVLFPRIVVTSAHCMQQKLRWQGAQFYVDDYLSPDGLSVSVTSDGKTETHDVAEIATSPAWRMLVVADAGLAEERFAHDIALIVTKDAIKVGTPPSLDKLADAELYRAGGSEAAGASERDDVLRSALAGRLTGHGVLVAFGAMTCAPLVGCDEAGIRRYRTISIKDSADCFNDQNGRPRWPPLPADFAATLPLTVWCMDSSVMPGDSGGALLIEGAHGEFYYLGVISAQQGVSPELAAVASRKRSLATALYPNLGFIAAEARKLGYVP